MERIRLSRSSLIQSTTGGYKLLRTLRWDCPKLHQEKPLASLESCPRGPSVPHTERPNRKMNRSILRQFTSIWATTMSWDEASALSSTQSIVAYSTTTRPISLSKTSSKSSTTKTTLGSSASTEHLSQSARPYRRKETIPFYSRSSSRWWGRRTQTFSLQEAMPQLGARVDLRLRSRRQSSGRLPMLKTPRRVTMATLTSVLTSRSFASLAQMSTQSTLSEPSLREHLRRRACRT